MGRSVVVEAARRQELVEEILGLMRRVMGRAFVRFEGPDGVGGLPLILHFALHFALRTGGATQSELAKFLGVTTGYVTGLVDKLERDRLVRRERDRSDRRRIHLVATARARQFHQQLHERIAASTAPLFDRWTDGEIEALRAMLQRLAAGDEEARGLDPAASIRTRRTLLKSRHS